MTGIKKHMREIFSNDVLRSIRAPISEARTLPSVAFTDPLFYEFEKTHILANTWNALDYSGRIPNPGDIYPTVLYGCPILLVRHGSEKINAFHNVSPYDGCEIVIKQQDGSETLETPYHGWFYDLDGKLISAPYHDGKPGEGAPPEGFDLVPVPCEEWLGTIFVNLNPEAEDFSDYMQPVQDELGDVDFSDLSIGLDKSGLAMIDKLKIKANWKIVIENYAPNVYHENSVHKMYRKSDHVPRVDGEGNKTYREIVDPRGILGLSYDNSIGSSFYPRTPFPEIQTREGEIFRRNTIANVYPNWAVTVLNQYARMTIFLPTEVDRCVELIATFYRGDFASEKEFLDARYIASKGGVIARKEDNAICESVQRTRSSLAFNSYPYNTFWDRPHYVFTNMVTDILMASLEKH